MTIFDWLDTALNNVFASHYDHHFSHDAHHHSSAFLSQSPSFMLINGITSPPEVGEQCLNADQPDGDGTELSVKPCLDTVSNGQGTDIFRFMDNKAIYTLMGKKCISLQDNDPAHGKIQLADCDKVASNSDGRAQWEPTANSQLKLQRPGNWCLTLAGSGIKATNSALSANVSTSNTEPSGMHSAQHAVDGKDTTYWASNADPQEPVELTIDYGHDVKLKGINIDWEYAPKGFKIESSGDGAHFQPLAVVDRNEEWTFKRDFANLSVKKLKITMTETHPKLGKAEGSNHLYYGIQNLKTMSDNLNLTVKNCEEAAQAHDARDKWFLSEVSEFNPCANSKLGKPPTGVPESTKFGTSSIVR